MFVYKRSKADPYTSNSIYRTEIIYMAYESTEINTLDTNMYIQNPPPADLPAPARR